jgi:hypothetical protein
VNLNLSLDLITVENHEKHTSADSNPPSNKHHQTQQRRQQPAVKQAPQSPHDTAQQRPIIHRSQRNRVRSSTDHSAPAFNRPPIITTQGYDTEQAFNKAKRQPKLKPPPKPPPHLKDPPSRNSSPTEAEASTAPQRTTPAATYAAPP